MESAESRLAEVLYCGEEPGAEIGSSRPKQECVDHNVLSTPAVLPLSTDH